MYPFVQHLQPVIAQHMTQMVILTEVRYGKIAKSTSALFWPLKLLPGIPKAA
jgi:hypothetical protein